jgi:hypothetical protein
VITREEGNNILKNIEGDSFCISSSWSAIDNSSNNSSSSSALKTSNLVNSQRRQLQVISDKL